MPVRQTRRLLIVEDDPLFARTLELELSSRFDVSHAADAAAAIRQLATTTFDAVILDLDLPPAIAGGGPDEGRELASRMRACVGSGPRIVILSQDVPEHFREELSAVTNAILQKPCAFDLLLTALSAQRA